MACLLIAEYNDHPEHRLSRWKTKIVQWVERGGMLLAHGSGAAKLLRDWFGKLWRQHEPTSRASLNTDQLSPQRSIKLLPVIRDSPLPEAISGDCNWVAGVDRGDAVYRSADGEFCSVALSSFAPSGGCVGFLGGLCNTMLHILVQLVNRQWTPLSRGVPAPPSPSSAAASSFAALGGCTTTWSFVNFANQFAEPKRSHLLSMVPGEVPAGWRQRSVLDGCVHSCCGHTKLAPLVNLRIHASNEALHKHCDKSTCAIWQDMVEDRSQAATAAVAASSAATLLSLPRMPSLDCSSSSSAVAAASAAPRVLVGAATSLAPAPLVTAAAAAAAPSSAAPPTDCSFCGADQSAAGSL